VLHDGVFLNRLYWPGYGSVQTHRGERYDDQLQLGDFTPGRWGWLLSDPQPCDPIPCKGKQGVFVLPDDVAAQIGGAR
jgi:hypothetical protein